MPSHLAILLHMRDEGCMTQPGFETIGPTRDSRWLITCDHAGNHVPPEIGDLGLPEADMARHIAYDIGAWGLACALGAALGAPVIGNHVSRLVIDPNRGEDDPTLVMKLYDGAVIDGNRRVDAAERTRRLEAYHRPYHDALDALAARRDDTVLVAVHSFTPQLRGRAWRPWEVGILYAWDSRLSDPLIDELAAGGDLTVGRNQPYKGHLPGDSVHRHALMPGRQNTLIEVRNDLIAAPDDQTAWAARLAPLLQRALEMAERKD